MALLPKEYMDAVVSIGKKAISEDSNSDIFWMATGFIFGYRTDEMEMESYYAYLVTNRHVLLGEREVYLRFNPKDNSPAKDYPLSLIKDGKPLYKVHPNKNVDVAVMPISAKQLLMDDMKLEMFACDGNIYTIKEMKDMGVTEGDGVFVLGFPHGMVGQTRKYVIVRDGCIARIQDMLNGHSNDFIVDAMVFPGNSGGPVLIRPALVSINGTKSVNESRLIGIVKSYIPYRDRAVSTQTGNTRIVFEENTGLSRVEPVDRIIETIESRE